MNNQSYTFSILLSADSRTNFLSRLEFFTRTSITGTFTFSIAPIIYYVEIYFQVGMRFDLSLKFCLTNSVA